MEKERKEDGRRSRIASALLHEAGKQRSDPRLVRREKVPKLPNLRGSEREKGVQGKTTTRNTFEAVK